MPRRTHSRPRASYFHVINRSVRGLVLFTQPADYRAFLSILNDAITRHPIRLIAYTVMPNHWQLVVGQTDTRAFSQCLQWVSSTHAVRLARLQETMAHMPAYEGRFTTMEIPAVNHLVRVSRYVERNALEAGLVRRAQDWPWCSLSERLQATPRVPLVNAPFLCSRAWADYVNTRRQGDSMQRMPKPVAASADFAEAPGRFA